ncbi:MAG TPA: cytochrome P450 [Streptosporangiaceae bacterium]
MAGLPRPSLSQLADPAIVADPYPVLARLREASPFEEAGGAMIVAGRHADVSAILRDPRASSERHASLLAPPGAERAQSFLSLDPPDHTRLRRLVSKAFTARAIATLEPRIRAVTDELLDAAAPGSWLSPGGHASATGDPPAGGAARPAAGSRPDGDSPPGQGALPGRGEPPGGRLEVVSQLAYPLPVRIISELLGVPPGDHQRFADWSARLVHSLQPQFGAADPAEAAAAQQARTEFAAYFRELIAERRARPAADLLSELVRAEDQGDRLTEDELVATCVLLLVAGHETTVGLISNAILALLRHPGQLASLQADPGLAAAAVEETLRYDAPVQLTARVARGGMRVGALSPPDGGLLVLLLAATGRDPVAFDRPDDFDIRRGAAADGSAPGSPAHLAFAAGAHFCLGAPLARLEATIALQAFARRVAGPQLTESAPRYKPNFNLRGPASLPLRFAALRPAEPALVAGR